MFNNLKFLTIGFLKDSEAWMSLLGSCPMVEKFTVEWIYFRTYIKPHQVDFILQTSLRHLKLKGNCDFIMLIFDEINKSNYGNLKTLELEMITGLEPGFGFFREINFEFPNDPADWNVEAAGENVRQAWAELYNLESELFMTLIK
jgi:hypothetical protein